MRVHTVCHRWINITYPYDLDFHKGYGDDIFHARILDTCQECGEFDVKVSQTTFPFLAQGGQGDLYQTKIKNTHWCLE